MRNLLLILFILLFSNINYGQQTLTFSDVEDLPEKKSAIAYANNDTDIYVVNGFTDTISFSPSVHKYNLESGTWSLVTNVSIKKRFASAEIVGDKLYIFNGYTAIGINDTIEVIDLNSLEISNLAINPNPTKAAGSAVWNGEIYSFGGLSAPKTYSNKLLKFNPESQEWTELSEMPIAAETKGEIVDGKLYIIGGYNGSVSKKVYIYDILKDEWESPITLPVGLSAIATTVEGTKIWLVGDYANLNFIGYFDTEDNSFVNVSNNMEPRRHCGTAAINGSLYVFGGNTASAKETAKSSVQKAELLTETVNFDLSSTIKVFPNPTYDILNFNKELEDISIYNSTGTLIKTMSGTFKSIHTNDLSDGNYFIIGRLEHQMVRLSWTKM